MSCYGQVNKTRYSFWNGALSDIFIRKMHKKLVVIVELPYATTVVCVDKICLRVCVNEIVVLSSPDLIQLLMSLPQELLPFFYSTTTKGQGVSIVYVHFNALVFLRVFWKVRTGWRCTGGCYKAGRVSALTRGSGRRIECVDF